MDITDVVTDQIEIKKSLFIPHSIFTDEGCNAALLNRSLNTLGLITPLTLYEDSSGLLHLVDGKRRLQYARHQGINRIQAVILPKETPWEEILWLVFSNKREDIQRSVMNKVGFIGFAASLGVSESWIVNALCKPLELKPHRSFLKEAERINTLPIDLRYLCHQKRFSLKQILNLTYYPEDLLLQLIAWRDRLQLTASTLEEIASNVKDYLKGNDLSLYEFISEPSVQEILDAPLSPSIRTQRLRYFIHTRRYPTLSRMNKEIEERIGQLRLPPNFRIEWDRTLENKRIDIEIQLQSPDQWPPLREQLMTEDVGTVIRDILDTL